MAKSSDNGHYMYYGNGDTNKTFILVKLTDSALNAIENHLSSNSLALPSISFKSDTNNGVLSFPVSKSNLSHPDANNENSGGPSERRFSFSLSNVEAGGPQGSFECLRQSETRALKSLGSIQYKMQIHASEDSYERTKERMAESQNESKKYCTKVIKGIGSTVGRRSKQVKKLTGFSQSIVNGSRDNGTRDSGGGGGNSHLHHSSALSSHNHHKSSSPTVIKGNSSGVNKYNPYHGSSNSTTASSYLSSSSGTGLTSTTTSMSSSLSINSSSISSSNSLANNLPSSSSNASSLPNSQPSSINGSNSSVNRDASKGNNSNSNTSNPNVNNSNSRNANSGSKVTMACNPEVMKKSLRERVIHLLALRPYKKPELLAKLNKEGIKEKDKKNLSQVFNTISKLKENAYNLAAHAWHEVQVDDWPFYSPEEREIVRRRKTQEIQQRSSTGKYGLSPLTCLQDSSPSSSTVATSSSSTNNSSSLSSTSKRSAETGSSSKRQRLNANNQSSSKRGLSPNIASNHTNSMMNNSTNSNNNNNNRYNNSYNSGKSGHDMMSEWSMKPKSPESSYYNNSASNNNVDSSVNNGESNTGSMSKSWTLENGSEDRSSHNTSDYYNGRSTNNNNLSDYDQYDNSHGNGHSAHDAHRLSNGHSNSSEGVNQTANGHHYSNNNNNRYSSTNNNYHNGNSVSTSKSDYNGDLHIGSGNSSSGNGSNGRKRLKNGYPINNSNSVNNINSHNNNNHNNNNNNHHSHNSSGMVNLLNSGSMVNGSNCSTPNSSPDSGTGSNDGNLSTISSKSLSSCELPDYAIKYVEITSDEQSKRYKDEFNREYKEYRRLHKNIDEVAQKFSAYEAKLKSLHEGTDEWNRTLEEVFKEYETIKKDYNYIESKRRAAYLHEKLSHIKKLIQEYKSSQGHRSTHYNTTTMSHHHTNYNNHKQSNHH